ncbi:MAG: tRNA pseudouridine(38-40) synthase TruA [Corallococcus sp.]|nr:tRNA pseudouridine(38-40) synthase TruA [Corallococcus sp.]
MRVKLTVEYIGTVYNGWQSQKGGNTVQDKLEYALGKFLGGRSVRVYAAGRTDAGVHATGQVVHFDIDKKINLFKLCLGVNLSLPNDISVTGAEYVDDDFDARFSAVGKTYRYRLYVSATRMPTLDVFRTQIYKPLDIDKMRRAADCFVGEHDFAAFQSTGSNLKGTVRTINSVDIQADGNLLDIVINGNAFLYNMVRIMCGTLVNVGLGKITAEQVAEMLCCRLKRSGKTLPAKGLTLEKVYY